MALKHFNRVYAQEVLKEGLENIEAGDSVKSRAPGSKGKQGKVLTINGDNVYVDFDGHKQSVPMSYLDHA